MGAAQKLYVSYDLSDLGLLPVDWDRHVAEVAREFGKLVHLDGDNPDTFEPEDTEGMDYYVVTGDIASDQLPWLLDLYRSNLSELASRAIGVPLTSANEIRHGININVLKGCKARYEWHVDPNPVSGILYVTTHLAHDGGGLVLRKDSDVCIVQPRRGEFVVFEGGRIPHSVAPLAHDQVRISVPLLFYFAEQDQIWPAHLESYLYGS